MITLTKKTFWPLAGFYGVVFLIFTAVFILSFHSPLFVRQNVLFYRGISLLVVTTIVTSAICILLNKHFFKLHQETLVAALLISISLNLSFFIVFPVTFDRSVTTYLLSAIKEKSNAQTCGGLSEKELEKAFIDEYVLGQKAINLRIKEQSTINMVKEQDNCIQLTPRGQNFLRLSEIIKKIYSVK